MISDRAAKYVWDARRAAERIRRFTAGHDFETYTNNEMLRAAVERQFEIIGEAFNALCRTDPVLSAGIPELPRVIAFRNVLIHGYATVGYATVDNRLEAGMLTINPIGLALPEVPFGGTKKGGYGSEVIKAYLSTKFVTHLGL